MPLTTARVSSLMGMSYLFLNYELEFPFKREHMDLIQDSPGCAVLT